MIIPIINIIISNDRDLHYYPLVVDHAYILPDIAEVVHDHDSCSFWVGEGVYAGQIALVVGYLQLLIINVTNGYQLVIYVLPSDTPLSSP